MFVEHTDHRGLLDPGDRRFHGRGSRCHPKGLACDASFTEELTGLEHCYDTLFALLRYDGDLNFARFAIVNGVCRIPLPVDSVLGLERRAGAPSATDVRKARVKTPCFWILRFQVLHWFWRFPRHRLCSPTTALRNLTLRGSPSGRDLRTVPKCHIDNGRPIHLGRPGGLLSFAPRAFTALGSITAAEHRQRLDAEVGGLRDEDLRQVGLASACHTSCGAIASFATKKPTSRSPRCRSGAAVAQATRHPECAARFSTLGGTISPPILKSATAGR
jgi:hypothetical protein